ncbi:TolC family protein [Pelobium manganitolerans]|uniref:TolC family protein n=1 Tax=Pelobium manganitolerans TaxID=1842495 RepID=UPI003FA3D7B8
MKKILFIMTTFLWLGNDVYSQQAELDLSSALRIAKEKTLDYKIATNRAKSAYWNYEAFKAGFLPKLSLNGNLPDYYRTINSITLPNGQNDFVKQNVANTSVNLNLSQNLGFTGGNLAIGSSLRRIDNFGAFENKAYTAVPFTLSYFQNNLFYNDFKWQKKIEPLKLKESERQFVENLEDISYQTVEKYFTLLHTITQLKLDSQNLKNIDTLVKITQSRFDIGTVQLNDVLQSKVSLLNAKKAMAASELAMKVAKQDFFRYLGLEIIENLSLKTPDSLRFFKIDADVALREAKENRQFVIAFQRRKLQAQQEIARTKSSTGPTVNLYLNLGLTQTGSTLNQSYQDLLRNQTVTLGFNIPLVDWGVNRSNRKRAESNLELEENSISQEQLSIEQQIDAQVTRWNMQQEQMTIAKETRDLAERRYQLAKQKYTTGALTYTDFNNAQLDKDRAVTDYLNNLRDYWTSYYLVRKITLYDFENKRKINLEQSAGLQP